MWLRCVASSSDTNPTLGTPYAVGVALKRKKKKKKKSTNPQITDAGETGEKGTLPYYWWEGKLVKPLW